MQITLTYSFVHEFISAPHYIAQEINSHKKAARHPLRLKMRVCQDGQR